MVTLYNTISQDGFIAGKDGSEDFIPDEAWDDFINICRSRKYDTVVFSRKAYEAIQKYPETMHQKLDNLNIKKVVVTKNSEFAVKAEYTIAHSLDEAFALGKNILFSSGPTLNAVALQEGLVDKIILNEIQEKIGGGLKDFATKPELILISQEAGNGRILSTYQVKKH
jgi:dihydrofolate reductase